MSRQLNKQTREEIYKDLLQEMLRTQDFDSFTEYHLDTPIEVHHRARVQFLELLNIHFKSRTCESCRYIKNGNYTYKSYTEDYKFCEIDVANSHDFRHVVTEDFGCNKWEPRDE